MNRDWMEIPGRLKREGFAVCYDRVSYDSDRPLWTAKASREGRMWSAMAKSLSEAFLELEGQIKGAGENWRDMIAVENQKASHATGAA